MSKRCTSIEIKDIPIDINFEGYLWLSDEKKPEILIKENVDLIHFNSSIPFIIEGNLWSEEHQLSIQIKNIDGQYKIMRFDLSYAEEDHLLDEKTYKAHDLGRIQEYRVIEAWEEKEDHLLSSMKTLVPAWTAFKGFVHPKNQSL